MFFAVGTGVAVERLAEFSEGVEERQEQAPALGQDVFDVGGATAEVASLDERVLFHVAQATDQRAAADGVQGGQQFRRAFRPRYQIARDQHRPLIADHL